jgi:hypothetical protein
MNKITLNGYYTGLVSLDEPTITSLELTDIINEQRRTENPDAKTLRHSNLIQKIEKELAGVELKFQSCYLDKTGRTRKSYALPKREATLMLMSESRTIRAMVYDHMTALEAENTRLFGIAKAAEARLLAKPKGMYDWKDDRAERSYLLKCELIKSGVPLTDIERLTSP